MVRAVKRAPSRPVLDTKAAEKAKQEEAKNKVDVIDVDQRMHLFVRTYL